MQIDSLKQKTLEKVLKTKKYKHIHPPTVERIIDDLIRRFDHKRLEKEVKKKLHQVWGAYFTRPNFEKLEEKIQREYEEGKPPEQILSELLMLQTSTKERLSIFDSFYQEIFNIIETANTVLEYGCGVNALSYHWMPEDIKYIGYDVDSELIKFINLVYKLLGQDGKATVKLGDVFLFDNYHQADVCLLLKVLVLFDRQQKDSSLNIMRAIPVRYLVVSFPTRTLAGIDKGMEGNYRNMFMKLVGNEDWDIFEIVFDNELVFIIDKQS